MSTFETSSMEIPPGGIPVRGSAEDLDRGLIGSELALVEAVLTLHEAVVGGEDQVGVSERPFGLELGDDPLDRLVDGQQGLEPPAVAAVIFEIRPPPRRLIRSPRRACP